MLYDEDVKIRRRWARLGACVAGLLDDVFGNELDNMLVPCCEDRRYFTFCVIPVGKASLFLNCLHAEAKNVADSSFSKMTWISSMNTCVLFPLRQLSLTLLIMASVITRSPIVFNCLPRLKMLKDMTLDLILTLVS